MGKFFYALLLVFLISVFVVVDGNDKSLNSEAFKQLFFDSINSKITPSNAASCSDADKQKCDKYRGSDDNCGLLKSFTNCLHDVLYKDCGKDAANQFCSSVNQKFGGKIPDCDLYCSANYLFISGSIGAVLVYKIFLEKFFLTF